jgi:hypothetical protein
MGGGISVLIIVVVVNYVVINYVGINYVGINCDVINYVFTNFVVVIAPSTTTINVVVGHMSIVAVLVTAALT